MHALASFKHEDDIAGLNTDLPADAAASNRDEARSTPDALIVAHDEHAVAIAGTDDEAPFDQAWSDDDGLRVVQQGAGNAGGRRGHDFVEHVRGGFDRGDFGWLRGVGLSVLHRRGLSILLCAEADGAAMSRPSSAASAGKRSSAVDVNRMMANLTEFWPRWKLAKSPSSLPLRQLAGQRRFAVSGFGTVLR